MVYGWFGCSLWFAVCGVNSVVYFLFFLFVVGLVVLFVGFAIG